MEERFSCKMDDSYSNENGNDILEDRRDWRDALVCSCVPGTHNIERNPRYSNGKCRSFDPQLFDEDNVEDNVDR